MMRALHTAASGMQAQQLNVDLIANNLANINTTGFKKERMEFQSLLYQTLHRANISPITDLAGPSNLQVGLGVRPIATTRNFQMGNLERTDNFLDFAINGPGFFAVEREPGVVGFSKDGSFRLSVDGAGGLMLATSQGLPILDVGLAPIIFPEDLNLATMNVDDFGNITFTDADGELVDLGQQIAIVQFPNVQGLEAIGSNLFVETAASGAALMEADGETPVMSVILQGVLESSNVQLAQEMVNIIIAQRAYEMNSTAIRTADEMLQQANNLVR